MAFFFASLLLGSGFKLSKIVVPRKIRERKVNDVLAKYESERIHLCFWAETSLVAVIDIRPTRICF